VKALHALQGLGQGVAGQGGVTQHTKVARTDAFRNAQGQGRPLLQSVHAPQPVLPFRHGHKVLIGRGAARAQHALRVQPLAVQVLVKQLSVGCGNACFSHGDFTEDRLIMPSRAHPAHSGYRG
jgi:hypothetical protein